MNITVNTGLIRKIIGLLAKIEHQHDKTGECIIIKPDFTEKTLKLLVKGVYFRTTYQEMIT